MRLRGHSSEFRMGQYKNDNYREDATHFTKYDVGRLRLCVEDLFFDPFFIRLRPFLLHPPFALNGPKNNWLESVLKSFFLGFLCQILSFEKNNIWRMN